MAPVDLVLEIFAALGRKISTRFANRAFKLFLLISPLTINGIPSILHGNRVNLGVSPSLTAAGIFGRMVGRMGLILVGHQCVYLLLTLTLALEK